jgi:hypothetical protein
MRSSLLLAAVILLIGCGTDSKPTATEPARKAEPVKPADESRRFPQTDLVDTKVVSKELMGKSFMPGGTIGH